MRVDCHVHVFDPDRFPYAPDTFYQPSGSEIGMPSLLSHVLDAHDVRHALLDGVAEESGPGGVEVRPASLGIPSGVPGGPRPAGCGGRHHRIGGYRHRHPSGSPIGTWNAASGGGGNPVPTLEESHMTLTNRRTIWMMLPVVAASIFVAPAAGGGIASAGLLSPPPPHAIVAASDMPRIPTHAFRRRIDLS